MFENHRVVWYALALFAYSVIAITLTAVSYSDLNKNSNTSLGITINWQTGAIMDIQIATNCPSGYENALSYTWPGTRRGCFCGEINAFARYHYDLYRDMYIGYCTWNMTKAGCKGVGPRPAKPLPYWNEVGGKAVKICVRRSKENWLSTAYKSDETCKGATNLKKCGTSPDNVFCTNEAQCPINDIKVRSLNLPADNEALSSCTPGNNCQVFAQDSSTAKILEYKRGDTFDALPTAQIRINEYGMCKDFNEMCITPGRVPFKLLSVKGANCKGNGNVQWKFTDSKTEAALFNLNGLTDTINSLSRFGYYPKGKTGKDYRWNLYSRSYIPWKIKCRGLMDDVVQYINVVEKLTTLHLVLMIMVIISCVVQLTALLYFLFTSTEWFDSYCDCWTGSYGKTRLRNFLPWFSGGTLIFQIPFLFVTFIKIVKSKDQLKGAVENNCSSSYIMDLLSEESNALHNTYVYLLVVIILWGLLSGVTILYFVMQNTEKKSKIHGIAKDHAIKDSNKNKEDDYPVEVDNDSPPIQGNVWEPNYDNAEEKSAVMSNQNDDWRFRQNDDDNVVGDKKVSYGL